MKKSAKKLIVLMIISFMIFSFSFSFKFFEQQISFPKLTIKLPTITFEPGFFQHQSEAPAPIFRFFDFHFNIFSA